jgi:long-chain acyl-CoA synthetase
MTAITTEQQANTVRAPTPVRGATIVDVFKGTARRWPSRTALRWRAADGAGAAWASMTWREYEQAVAEVAAGLRSLGLSRGDRVGLLSANRPEWHIADIGTLTSGLVTVPVYPTNAAGQVAYLLRHSGARLCFVDTADQLAKVLLRRSELPQLERVVLLGESAGLDDDGFVLALAQLRRIGAKYLAAASTSFDEMVRAVAPEDLATLVYTSGTTGPPKGTMITHANVMATMRSLTSLIEIGPDDRFLSFLPLSHITERSISDFGQITSGAETWFAQSIATVPSDLQACRPTLLFAVPRLWEKFRDGVLEQTAKSPAPLRLLAERYFAAAAARHGGHRNATTTAEYLMLDRLVGRAIRRRLGLDKARMVSSGAAPIHEDLLHWFHGIGIPIAEGYGQTEVSLCTSTNVPGDTRIGTVGRPIPGVSVRIAGDGEILVKGDNVCAGYWADKAATRELIDKAGWLHTGDLGQLDADGYLRVTGRKKDLLITAYGKNISPEELETALRVEPLIAQAVVVGDGRPFLAALLTIDAEAAAEWAAHHGRAPAPDTLIEDAELHREIDRAVERVNAGHSHAEGIRRWRLLPHDLTVAGGELTPTLKVKRNVVVSRWAALIEEMYAAV